MREIEGAGILHKSDNDYNIKVTYFIKLAKQTKNERESIAVLSGAKDEKDLLRAGKKIDYVIEEPINNIEQEEIEEIEEER